MNRIHPEWAAAIIAAGIVLSNYAPAHAVWVDWWACADLFAWMKPW